jgi:hypothetical protein
MHWVNARLRPKLAHRVTSLRCNDWSSIGDELDSGNQSDRRIHEFTAQSRFRFDRIETGLWIPDLTRFPDTNRYPPLIKSGGMLRWKTRQADSTAEAWEFYPRSR